MHYALKYFTFETVNQYYIKKELYYKKFDSDNVILMYVGTVTCRDPPAAETISPYPVDI